MRHPHGWHPSDLARGRHDTDEGDAALSAGGGEAAVGGLLGAPPQFAGEVVPDDLVGVVVAVQAQRLAEPRIVGVVAGEARCGLPVWAGAGGAAGAAGCGTAVATLPGAAGVARHVAVVDGAEGGGGEGGEDDRVPADRGGDALAAGQAATDDLVGVAPVDPGAVLTYRFAAVAARLVERSVGQLVGVQPARDAAGVPVDGGDGAGEADRASAAAGGAGVLQPAGEFGRGGAVQDLGVTADGETGPVDAERGGHDYLLFRGWQGRKTKHHQPWTGVRWWCSSCLLAPPRGRLTPEGGVVVVPLPADGSCPFTLVDSLMKAGTGGEPGISASGGLPHPWRCANPGHRGRQAKAVLGLSADSEDRHGGRCDREPAGRGPHQRQEGRSISPTSRPAIRQEGRAGVLDEGQSSTGYRHVNVP